MKDLSVALLLPLAACGGVDSSPSDRGVAVAQGAPEASQPIVNASERAPAERPVAPDPADRNAVDAPGEKQAPVPGANPMKPGPTPTPQR